MTNWIDETTDLSSHRTKGQKSEIKILAELVSSGGLKGRMCFRPLSLCVDGCLRVHMACSLYDYVQIAPSYKETSHIG